MRQEDERITLSSLDGCEGFGVYGPRARIGTVEEVRLGAGGRPVSLAVRAGLLGSWLVNVPAHEVEEICRGERRILVHAGGVLGGPTARAR